MGELGVKCARLNDSVTLYGCLLQRLCKSQMYDADANICAMYFQCDKNNSK